MPYLPPTAHPNLLSNIPTATLMSWIDDGMVPSQAPHHRIPVQFGCTINHDYDIANTRTRLKKGMQGHAMEKRGDKIKIQISGITGQSVNGMWVENEWVPASIVNVGQQWKPDINDWQFRMNLGNQESSTPISNASASDTSILGETIASLINEFYTYPSSFMGTKLQDLRLKRGREGMENDVDSVAKIIIKGIRDAGLYATLNQVDFTVDQLVAKAAFKINFNLQRGTAGIYARFHTSGPGVTRWQPNEKYLYVGKTVDYREHFRNHELSPRSYGDLTRNSKKLESFPLCVLNEQDTLDLGFVAEQIFVCLLETYSYKLLSNTDNDMARGIGASIGGAEAVRNALYFRAISRKIFQRTGFKGAISRPSFGVFQGANYSMPFAEWGRMDEQTLFIRRDTHVKSRSDGSVFPLAIFRTARSRVAKYRQNQAGTANPSSNMLVFRKHHLGDTFCQFYHTVTAVPDGTMGPRRDDPYHTVFEVRTDGGAHPHAWSRLPIVGGSRNWDEGRSMAIRVEWEHPPKSGQWSFVYLKTGSAVTFRDNQTVGSNKNYIKSIAITRWLMNSEYVDPQSWMPRLIGCANVIQTVYDCHTQTILVQAPPPFTMRSAKLRSMAEIATQMRSLGLQNVNFPRPPNSAMKRRTKCDTCTLLGGYAKTKLGIDGCIQISNTRHVCQLCLLFGRPCCSYTLDKLGFKEPNFFTDANMQGTGTGAVSRQQLSSDEVDLNNKWLSVLIMQPLKPHLVQSFHDQPIDISNNSEIEDDLSNYEEVVDEEELADIEED